MNISGVLLFEQEQYLLKKTIENNEKQWESEHNNKNVEMCSSPVPIIINNMKTILNVVKSIITRLSVIILETLLL